VINVVKFYKPLLLSPGEEQEFVVEDLMQSAKFIFDPLIRVINPAGGDDCSLEIKWIFDLGFGDDPLWRGREEFIVVNETLPPDSFKDYTPSPQIDKSTSLPTRHVVKIGNLGLTEDRVIKTLIYGLTETQIQVSGQLGVIQTNQPI
jgi:hypothetical protein